MIAFGYLAIGLAGYLLLFYLGWPLWTVLAPARSPISVALGAPMVGLALLQVFSWYWLDHAGSGWSTGLPILLGLNVVATLVCIVWRRSKLSFTPTVAISALALIAVVAATSALFVSNYQRVVTKGDRIEAAAATKSNDIAAYAVISRFVHESDFATKSPISGYRLGESARGDVFGVFTLVDSTAIVTGVGDWQALLPFVLLAMLLTVLALRDLADSLFPGSRARASVIALIASGAFLFAYIQSQASLSQLLAMPIAFALGSLYFGALGSTGKAEFFRTVAIAGLLDIVLAFTYPHMLFLAQPVLLGAALVASIGHGWVVRVRRTVVVAIGGVIVAAAVIPQRFDIAVAKLRFLAGDTSDGFPLAAFTPLQLLGFQRQLTTPSTQTLLLQGAVVLAVVGGSLAVLWRDDRRAGIFCAASVGLVLGSYGLVYLVRGRSYTQWKWISFFQPLYMAMVILVVCIAAATLLRRARVEPTLRVVAGVVAGAVLMFFVVRDTRVLADNDAFWMRVPTELTSIGGESALAGTPAVNVDVPPFWDTMWATYFLLPRTVYLQNASYYAIVKPRAVWTLEPAGAPDPPGAIVRKLNPGYKLVRGAPAG